MQGNLEAHKNGFLYTSRRGEKIKILYNNVKFAFFQPPDNDIVILVHFHLRNGLMIGKKQHKDIQFYVEVGEVSTDLGKRASAMERDEVEAEHREKIMRSKTKKLFKGYMEKVCALPLPASVSTNREVLRGWHLVPHALVSAFVFQFFFAQHASLHRNVLLTFAARSPRLGR